MSAIEIRKLGPEGAAEFVLLPFKLYRHDKHWVAPLIAEQIRLLRGGSHFIASTEHAFLMAYKDGRACGRILVGRYDGMRKDAAGLAYLSLPAADDPLTLGYLLEAAEGWARLNGLPGIVGPWSPTDSDDDKGLLVEGFEGPPSLMGSYNKPWYKDVFDSHEYRKLVDFVSYTLVKYPAGDERVQRMLDLAFKRTRTVVSTLNRKDLLKDFRDIHSVMLASVGDNPDLPSPTWEQFLPEAQRLAKMADDKLILIARRQSDGSPVAFVAAMPNWSEVLKKMRGRILPFGWIHALGAKRRIKGVRVLMQFCIPEYQGSGILPVLYAKLREKVAEGDYEYWEAGTIRDDNIHSMKPVEDVGGKLFRVYRWYKKVFGPTSGS